MHHYITIELRCFNLIPPIPLKMLVHLIPLFKQSLLRLYKSALAFPFNLSEKTDKIKLQYQH